MEIRPLNDTCISVMKQCMPSFDKEIGDFFIAGGANPHFTVFSGQQISDAALQSDLGNATDSKSDRFDLRWQSARFHFAMLSRFIRSLIGNVAMVALIATGVPAEQDAWNQKVHEQEEERSIQKILDGMVTTPDMTEWSSLQLDITVKRESLQVFGQTNFTIFANPSVKVVFNQPQVLYDAFASFREKSTTSNYTLVNGTAYLSSNSDAAQPTAKCLSSNDAGVALMIHSIINMINAAEPNAAGENGNINCLTGDVFNARLASANFDVCKSKPSGFTMNGSAMDISVEFLDDRVDISVPVVESKCEKLVSPTELTKIGISLLQRGRIQTR